MRIAGPVNVLLARLIDLGIELETDGEKLRYRPRSALTPDLASRVKAHKRAMLTAGGDAELWRVIGTIRRHYPGAKVVGLRTARERLASLIRDARGEGDGDQARNLREALAERRAIVEIEGGLSRAEAEALALADLLGRVE